MVVYFGPSEADSRFLTVEECPRKNTDSTSSGTTSPNAGKNTMLKVEPSLS